MERDIQIYHFEWSGYRIEVRYEDDWLKSCRSFMLTAHLEVVSVNPPRAPLPITETGYKSHFIHPAVIADEGGPVAYVQKWLDASAQLPEWREQEAKSRQFALF